MELINRPEDAPKDSRGAGADVGKILQATALAAQLGKTVEEVLAFMGTTTNTPQELSPLTEEVLKAAVKSLKTFDETKTVDAKGIAPKDVPQDGFIITETIDPSEATEADLAKLSEDEDDNQDWSGKIRIGSKVRIIYQVNASRINWVGKRGKVVRIIGNEAAKVFEVEFSGKKIPLMRLNKQTNKIEKGFKNKPIVNVFSEDQIELAD